ncbi:MAG: GumC family protein [Planctomycetota bacterium]|jgi:uncharacterized protein involved in exopolysaccharide biosynthesis
MAAIQSANQLDEFLDVLRRRRLQIILPVIYTVAIGAAIATFLPEKYEVETQVNLLEARVDDPSNLSKNEKETSTLREVQNAEYHVKQPSRIRSVLKSLYWTEFEELDELGKAKFIQKLQGNITVRVLPKAKDQGSQFIDLAFIDVDPERARDFLSSLVDKWVRDVVDRERNALIRARDSFQDLRREAIADYDDARARYNELLKESGLTSAQLGNDGRTTSITDSVQVELDALSGRQTDLEVEISAKSEEIALLRATYEAEEAYLPKQTIAQGKTFDDAIKVLEAQIQQIELKRQNLKPAHPQYLTAQAQISDLEDQIEDLRAQSTEASIFTELQPNPRKIVLQDQLLAAERDQQILLQRSEALQSQIDRKTTQVLKRKDDLAALEELQREYEESYAAYQEANAEFNEVQQKITRLDSYGPLYEITKEPVAPETPSQPNVYLILVLSVFAGAALGLGSAFAMEFLKPGFRGASDASRALPIPVLGVISQVETRRDRRERFTRAAVVGLATLLIVGSILFVTWAWNTRSDMLGTGVMRFLDDLHASLR